jgi:pyrimidine-specific ribonucleoside hydrolase
MRTCLLVSYLLLVALVAGCGSGGAEVDPDATPVVIDSDGAFDDVKAIVYLLQQPDVEVLALTLSGTGIAHCPEAAENVSAVLERLGAPDIPVACGRTTPLVGDNQAPQAWRDAADTLGRIDLPEPRSLEASASELLAETLADFDEVVLVALGPLTNVAEAVLDDATVLDGVEMTYFMGGAVDVGGNVLYGNPNAEFNVWADPHAAAVVFDTDVPITMIPLDATNDVPVTPHLYEAVAAHAGASPVSRLMADYLEATPLLGGMYHWDELAAVIAIDESVATFEDRSLTINDSGAPNEGATVEALDGRPVRVAVDADRADFERHFFDAILGTGEPGVAAWEPDGVVSWDGITCTYSGADPFPDDLFIRIDNDGSETVAVITGRYDPGTTLADMDAYRASGESEPPEWWTQSLQIVAPAGARDVWPVQGGGDLTAICYVGADRFWEIAGIRLTE